MYVYNPRVCITVGLLLVEEEEKEKEKNVLCLVAVYRANIQHIQCLPVVKRLAQGTIELRLGLRLRLRRLRSRLVDEEEGYYCLGLKSF